MTNWHCDYKCRISKGGAGPWGDHENFANIRNVHRNCPGFQIGEPKLKGRANWENTEIEKEATKVFNEIIYQYSHELVAYLKGPEKVCLIKDKWEWVNQK